MVVKMERSLTSLSTKKYRLPTNWLIPAFLVFGSSALNMPSALAQNYSFSANYDLLSTSKTITPEISASFLSGKSNDAPYGLDQISGQTYAKVDAAKGLYSFNTDPKVFGLNNVPSREVMFFGSGSNKLFGSDNATGTIDFTTLTAKSEGIFTIAGGEGIFTGATGTLAFSQVDTLSLDPNIPVKTKAFVSGSIQVISQKVPESGNLVGLLFVSAISVGVLRHKSKVQMS